MVDRELAAAPGGGPYFMGPELTLVRKGVRVLDSGLYSQRSGVSGQELGVTG